MDTVALAINYVDFDDKKKSERQSVAMEVLSNSPDWLCPIVVGLDESVYLAKEYKVHDFKLLKRDSRLEINNNRSLPYIKEILSTLAKERRFKKIGYINSDILIGPDFFDVIQRNHYAFILSRSDIAEVSSPEYLQSKFKVIYGGDKHHGADGFFFKRSWWIRNQRKFPEDLIIGETEWDTCYRKIIYDNCRSFIEKRALHHVYHDQSWNWTSNGARNNMEIWETLK